MNEDRLIVAASKTKLGFDDISLIEEVSSNGVDWKAFERKALFHRVTTLIYYSLKEHKLLHLIPQEIAESLHHDYVRLAVENHKFLEEVEILSELINDKIILLKGVDLIQSLYPNIAIRSMCDIDILIEKDKVVDVWNRLRMQGFYAPLVKSNVHLKVLWNKGKHLQDLYNGKCKVDVHFNLFPGLNYYNVTQAAFDQLIAIDLDKKIYRLSDTYQFIYLCSHFCGHLPHGGTHLRRLCDINELVSSPKHTIDWTLIESLPDVPVLKSQISLALEYVKQVFETKTPALFGNNYSVVIHPINLNSYIDASSCTYSERYTFSPTAKHLAILDSIKSLDSYADKASFLYRTICPQKQWIREKFGSADTINLLSAYFKYWGQLVGKTGNKPETVNAFFHKNTK